MTEYPRLTSIHVVNFQTIVDSTLELGNLTVLAGSGDVGKSAFLRAMRAVFLNDAVDEDIRHDTKKTEVTLTFEDGVEIEWSKALKKGGCYRMGDTEYNKCQGRVPEAIAEYLGIGSIEIDSTTTLTPQLSDQQDPAFIIMETGSKRARILGKATRLDTVITAQMQCKKELDQTRRASGEAATNLTEVEEHLAAIPDYKAIENELNVVEADIQTLQGSLERADQAEKLADQIEEVRSRATALDIAPLYGRLDVEVEALGKAERLQYLAERIPELVQATALNVVPLYAKLTTAAESLDRAESLRRLGKRIPELTKEIAERTNRIGDHKEALLSFQIQLASACEDAGICEVCGGLLSHEECAG